MSARHFKQIAQRAVNARDNFVEYAQKQGFTAHEGELILETYIKLKAVKLDFVHGYYVVKHGGFLDHATMLRALKGDY